MKAAIIGGGLGGMVSALLLARAGAEVTIYERKEQLGGRLAFEKGDRYRIDRGPTIVLLPEMLRSIAREAGIPDDEYELLRCDPMYRFHYPDGRVLTKWTDTDRMAEELDTISASESRAFRRYMRDMEPVFQQGKAAFLERPFLQLRSFFSWHNMKLLAKLRVYMNMRQMAESYFGDKRVIDAFSLQSLYIGGLPLGSPSLYTFIPYAEHAFGIWYLKGGYASFVNILERALVRENVTVCKGEHGAVRQITTENGAVTGLLLEDGTRHNCETVIYNGDFPFLSSMLHGITEPVKKRQFKPSSGCILVYVGVNKRWEAGAERTTHQFMLPDSFTDSLRTIAASGNFPNKEEPLPAYYIFNPCEMDEAAAPPGETVLYFLIPAPIPVVPYSTFDWSKVGNELAERVLADAEARLFPGLTESIEWKKIRTPQDGANEGWFMGGSFGIAPTWSQSGAFRPQFAPYKVKGLYSVGASIHPGGGVPIVMQGAKMLANHVIEEWATWKAI
ncbi:phytoene desaturase [Paenibacillus castaneae]|uniref:phytoene desaturase family protein n=1 Tax=Paenibacillus castaneae TaxID=474957 RepID=UPI000C9A9753|nr:phytoene desaturase family protein [Paenibacillus castaneae]NIK76024.1 phytoene desaturase [Paenibacillus castaneae]